MKNIDKLNKNIYKLLYLVILISPFLDTLTYLMRVKYNFNMSLSTILKPLIVGIVYLYLMIYVIFIKKDKNLYVLLMFLILGYSVVHLLLIKNNFFVFSVSTFSEEVKKLIQIVYITMLLEILITLFKYKEDFNFDSNKLIKCIAISAIIYYAFFALSLITNTSALSYSNGVNYGFKSWLVPSHLINHLGALTIPLVWLEYKKSNNKWWMCAFIVMCGLCYIFIGTKSSTYSIIIILVLLFAYELLKVIFSKNKNEFYSIIILIVLLLGCFFSYKYTYSYKNTISMYDDLEISEGKISQKVDTTINKVEEENKKGNNIKYTKEKKYYLNKVKNSLDYLEKVTKNNNLSGFNNRNNEIIYNGNIFLNINWKYKIFGIGFCNQPDNLYMENDIFSLLFNYGIIPFVILYLPLLFIYLISIFRLACQFIKGKLFHYEEEYILLISLSLFILLTYTTGYMFLQTSLIIIYLPIIFHCNYLFINKKEDIDLKLRTRKYTSKLVRPQNAHKNNKELVKELSKEKS